MIKIFISSVQKEFAEERRLICTYLREDALLGKFFQPFIFEELPAINLSAPEAYLTEAATSDIILVSTDEIMDMRNQREYRQQSVSYGLGKPKFHQDSDFKVTIWRKQVSQKSDEISQEAQQLSQKKDEVTQKIEQLSQKAQQLSQKMSYRTIEGIFYAINNDAYVSIKVISSLCECTDKTVKRYLSFLTQNGFISHIGPDKGGYRIINWSKLDAQ